MVKLIGFEKEYSDLVNRYKSNNLPNSILIHGLSGIGKRTFLNKLVKNKYDKSNLLFHQTVIQGYKKIANPKRYIMVNASLSKHIIHKKIIKKLNL